MSNEQFEKTPKHQMFPDEKGNGEPIRRKRGKITALLILLSIAALVCAYLVVAWTYRGKFFRGTVINGMNCSEMTVDQVESLLETETTDYSLTITFRGGKTETIQGSSVDYSCTTGESVQEIRDSQIPILWISGYFSAHEYKAVTDITYDEEKLKAVVYGLPETSEAQMEAPADAYVGWQEDRFVVVPETEGSSLDREKLLQAVIVSLEAGETQLDAEEKQIYDNPSIRQDDPELTEQADQLNRLISASITYTLPTGTQTLDGNILKSWLVQDDKGSYQKDEECWNQNICRFVEELADSVDTLHKDIPFQTTGAGTVTVPNEVFGWQVDREAEIARLTEELENQTVTVREPVYASRAVSGENYGIGSTYVEIDLSRQHMWVYQEGELWMETDIVSGKMTHTRYTPAGVYQVYDKEQNRRLRGPVQEDGSYEWDVEVAYWMPFNEAIGMHDAPWQSAFGGTYYMYGGSRGCINMPTEKAARLYDWITVGTPVITYYSEEMEFID